jgi:mannosyltransferase
MKITRQTFCDIYLPVLLFLVAFCWKLHYIGTRDICIDEPFTIFHAQSGVGDILKSQSENGPNPPLFMFLLHFWIKIFGISPYSVRILPLLFNSLTTVFIYLTGKKFFSIWCGILASAIFILSTYHFYFGLETRAYSMLSMATAASLYYFLSLVNNFNNRKFLVALVLANFVLIYSHYFGWFVVFVQFLISFLYLDNKKLFRTLLVATVLTGIIFLPLAPVFIKHFLISGKGTWVQPPAGSDYLNQLWWFLNTKLAFNIIVLILIGGIVHILLTKSPIKISCELITVFVWWFVPFTIMFLVSAKMPMFIDRYILFNSIGLYLFIAVALHFLYNKMQVYVLSILIMIVMFTQLQINSKVFYYREVQNMANNVRSHLNNNSIILIYPYWADLGFMYYFNRDIYKDFNNYDSLLLKTNIFHVWNLNEVKETLEKNKNRRIIYIQDGEAGDNKIYNYLDSIYIKTDSVFYPQCLNVSVFESLQAHSLSLAAESASIKKLP